MNKIYLAFLWHQHQPMYKNPSTGIYELPWVRLHATKDYYDTAAILDEFPKIKSNFNLVPSLISQLDEYARGVARDKFLDLTLKPAEALDAEDRVFILSNFFMANWDTMIFPYPRYTQLLDQRGRQVSSGELRRVQAYFKPGDMRDLQVWFNLAWMDPYWRQKDELVGGLYRKGRDFTEEEKKALIAKQLDICGRIVGKYAGLQERGQIEVSVTPFYHPILPLLCDTNTALGSTPHISLPKRFQHREDAVMQVQKAVDMYVRSFGKPPRGSWPAEGSVSDEVIPIFADAGVQWIATDEEILFRTVPEFGGSRRNLYRPYRLNVRDKQVNIIFRDHALSDAIGFVYTRWNAADAVNDFMHRLRGIRDAYGDPSKGCLVPVILDGENCWEYYANDGWDFLRGLYEAISNDPSIETVRIGDYLEQHPPETTLRNIWPGSWINGNYGIWIGHQEDNQAWAYLGETRQFLANYVQKYPDKKDSPSVKAAWERIYAAEGSDWNWWYGDDHSSGNDETFDYLFRQHLISVYEVLGERVPDHLHKAIKGIARKTPVVEPIDFISPRIDGRITNYFEWQPAGFYQAGHAGGSMHQVDTILKSFHYGFDLQNLSFRLDLNVALDNPDLLRELSFKIAFLSPRNHELFLSLQAVPEPRVKEYIFKSPLSQENLLSAAANKIVEFSLPVDKLQFPEGNKTIEFVIIVQKNNLEIERWPYQSSVSYQKPSEEFRLKSWTV